MVSTVAWQAIAHEARVSADHGSKADRKKWSDKVAARYGLKAQTLRRYVAASAFAESTEPDMAAALARQSVAAVEIIAKWHSYAPSQARQAAEKLILGRVTVRRLRALEAEARAASDVPPSGRSHNVLLRRAVKAHLETTFPGIVLARTARHEMDPDVDFTYLYKGVDRRAGVVLTLGSHSRDESGVKVGDKILKALGLTTMIPEVILAVGDSDVLAFVERWIQHNGVAASKRLLVVNVDGGEAIASRRR